MHVFVHYYYRSSPILRRVATMDDRCLETALYCLRRLVGPTGKSLTDGQLLERFSSLGDQAAFELLLRRHGPLVCNVCWRILGNSHDVEDALQATWLVLVRKAASLGQQVSVAGWLHRVAYRIAIRARAKQALSRCGQGALEEQEAGSALGDPADSEMHAILHEELNGLPEKYRMAILLCDLEGKTHVQAADELRWPLGTLHCRVRRGREQLKTRLTRRGLTVSAGLLGALLTEEIAASRPALALHHSIRAAATLKASTRAALLAEGVLHAMFMKQIRLVAAMVVTVVVLGTGLVMLAQEAWAPCTVAAAAPASGLPVVDPADQQIKPEQPQAEANPQLAGAWADLASDDETKALKAVLALLSMPKETTHFLKENLKPVTVDPKQIGRLIADLDSDKFALREQASHELTAMGEYAVPYLRGALDGKPALEPQMRLEKILQTIKAGVPSLAVMRSLRAIAVLEKIGTPQARQILEALARGRAKALATQEAEAALDRLTAPPVITLQRHFDDLISKDAGQVARALIALAATPKETVDFLSTTSAMKPKPQPTKGDDKLKERLKKLDAERAALAGGKGVPTANQATPPGPSHEVMTKRVGVLLEHIGTPEARQVWEAIQQGKLLAPAPKGGKSATSPDGKLRAVIDNDGSIGLYDIATGKQLSSLRGTLPLASITFTEDGRMLAAETAQGQRLLYDLRTGKLINSSK
jgi:RNA polymerase sigma factor (sigma-70 family)